MASDKPPSREPTATHPHAIASSATRPNGSFHRDGTTAMRCRLSSSARSGPVFAPVNVTCPATPRSCAWRNQRFLLGSGADDGQAWTQAVLREQRHRLDQKIEALVGNEPSERDEVPAARNLLAHVKERGLVGIGDHHRLGRHRFGHGVADGNRMRAEEQQPLGARAHAGEAPWNGNPGVMNDDPGPSHEQQRGARARG